MDDGSTDGTAALAEALLPSLPRLRLLRHETYGGAGASLRTGLAAARFPLLLTATCDRQFQPADLPLLLTDMDRVHLCAGYRVWQPVPWPLRCLGWVYRLFVRVVLANPLEPLPGWLGWRGWTAHVRARLLFGLRVQDVYCPFRLYRRAILERMPIQSEGPFAEVEVLAKANFLGAVMTEAPVRYQPRSEALLADNERRQLRSDFRRVFWHPDFGPIPQPQAAPKEPETIPDAPA